MLRLLWNLRERVRTPWLQTFRQYSSGSAHLFLIDLDNSSTHLSAMQWDDDIRQSSVRLHDAQVAAQCPPTNRSRRSGTVLLASTKGPVPLLSWPASRGTALPCEFP